MDLYRVIPFRRLKEMAEQAALAFVSYRVFKDDPHEALLIRALTTQDGLRDVHRALTENGESPSSAMMLIMAARNADASAFMQCWTQSPEHNLMWERYGEGDQAVRIRMSEADQLNLPNWISLHEARYEDSFDIWKELQHVTARQNSVSISTPMVWSSRGGMFASGILDFRKSLTFKLKAYKHEDEIRLMTPVLNDIVLPGQQVPTAPWANSPNGNKNVTLVPIGNVKNIVTSIMTGPDASDDLQRQVEMFCKTHGITYEGKSKLKTPKYTGTNRLFTSDPD